MVPRHIRMEAIKGRTLNEKYNVGPLYFSCESNYSPISVPNGGSLILAAFISFTKGKRNGGVHEKYGQERRGSESQIG
jgi:hypothetical protein